jgi:hypothetical protein
MAALAAWGKHPKTKSASSAMRSVEAFTSDKSNCPVSCGWTAASGSCVRPETLAVLAALRAA